MSDKILLNSKYFAISLFLQELWRNIDLQLAISVFFCIFMANYKCRRYDENYRSFERAE